MGEEAVLDVTGREVAWLKVNSYETIESCGLEWKRLNGKIDEEEVPGDYDVPDTDSLKLLLQCDSGWTQHTNPIDPGVESAWENLKAESTGVQHKVPTTIEKVLDLNRETLVSRDELQKVLTTVEGEAAKRVEELEKLEAEPRDATLKMGMMEDW